MNSKDERLKKSLENFVSLNAADTSGGHKASIYQKAFKKTHPQSKRHDKVWYVKESYSPDEPLELEVIPGEIYRYWIGNTQPKTRLVIDGAGNRYVASEGVPGFKTFSSIMQQGGKPSDYKTLARILVSALVLAEIDLKADNIGDNDNGKSVKIDHDSSLWPLVLRSMSVQNDINQTNFSYEDLDNILEPKTFKPAVWAGGLSKDIKEGLQNNEEFRVEVYRQILRIMVYPSEILTRIQDVNAPSDLQLKTDVQQFIQERMQLLRAESLKSKEFRSFISNLDLNDCQNQFASELNEFFSENKAYVEEGDNLFQPMVQTIEAIKTEVGELNTAHGEELHKMGQLKTRLKLDKGNPEHLMYWQEKVKLGGTSINCGGIRYYVPAKIAQMMQLEVDSFASFREFKNGLDAIRRSRKDNQKPGSLFSFFGEIKDSIVRDRTTQSLYEAQDIEEVDLRELGMEETFKPQSRS
ncbi:hypothetical protein EAS68_02365 [Legionella jordanis]|uniref:hypothetical protein n=1 Tax=Legionella jordanis TaxID=456 RepID=UPI000EFF57D9|nr:hypothetical protein [Legionella jordanis]RMX21621.1 hypothetical protein EAS68_02365 [Legionella jordanis]HAT8714534.1 hypothetical protein [Legionella jordanis]